MRRKAREQITVAFMVGLGVLLLAGVASVPSGGAVFPGANGKIAFERDRAIFTANPDGSGLTRLTNDASLDREPVWSPDGRRIAFTQYSADSEVNSVFVMNADGSAVRQLASCGHGPPVWSPDARKIAFDGCGPVSFFVVNIDGSYLTGQWGVEPDWSPDGRKIVFSRPDGIVTMNADGTHFAQLTSERDWVDWRPKWSPDGHKIVFEHVREAANFVAMDVMDADGSGVTQLSPEIVLEPAWSPDGRTIAFGGAGGISTIGADGSNLTQLTNDGGYLPVWSPDGRKIAYTRRVSYDFRIYTMNADGSDQTQLINDSGNGWENDANWQTMPSADLALAVTARTSTRHSGRRLTYTITVHNGGPSNAIGVVITDHIPRQARFVNVQARQGTCKAAGPMITCSLGLQPAGTTRTIQIVVTTAGVRQKIHDAVHLTSSTPDPSTTNNTATTTTT